MSVGKMSRLEASTVGRRRLSKTRRAMQLRWGDRIESSPEGPTSRRARLLEELVTLAARINSEPDVHSVIRVVTHGARDLIGVRQAVTSVVIDTKPPRLIHVAASTERYP